MRKLFVTLFSLALVACSPALAGGCNPNNYINTNDQGVMFEIEKGSKTECTEREDIISRDMVTQKELDNLNLTNGQDGMDGMNGLSLMAALNSFQGNGIGFGISNNDSSIEFSVASGMSFNNGWYGNAGITYDDRDGDVVGSLGLGFSF